MSATAKSTDRAGKRSRSAIPLLVGGGSALGLAARLVDELGPKWIGNIGALWFVAGFLAGRLVARPRLGAVAGAACLAVATVAYYALRLAIDPISVGDLVPIPLGWLVVGGATGIISGWFGARSLRHPESWGAPVGVFMGEAIAVLALRGRVTQAVLEVICALACFRLMKSAWGRGLLVAAVTVPNVAIFAMYYRLVLWWH